MTEHYVFSSGGGRQSSAALVLSAHGILPYKHHLFCNVGDDSEDTQTLEWVRNVLMPYAEDHEIQYSMISKKGKTLYQTLTTTQYSIPIPAKFHYANGKKNLGMRSCTTEYKIRVADRNIKIFYGDKRNPPLVHVGLGISVDEIQRAKKYPIRDMGSAGEVKTPTQPVYWKKSQEYPFIFNEPFEIFGKQYKKGVSAKDCTQIVMDAGLGEPPKSACWFCPYHSIAYWKEQAKIGSQIYHRGVALENLLREKEPRMKAKHEAEGKEFNEFQVFLTDAKMPLSNILDGEVEDGIDENCESGYCMI